MPISEPLDRLVRRDLWRQRALPEHPPAEVGEGIGEEGGDEDVDEQRAAVQRQLAEQHRVGERQPDPDEGEHRHRHRPGDVAERRAEQREDQHQRHGRDQCEEDLEGGPEVGGGDHSRRAEECGRLERSRTGGHPEELDLGGPREADHRDREDRTAGGDDDDREDDPRDRPEHAGERLRAATAAAPHPRARPAAAPGRRIRLDNWLVLAGLPRIARLRLGRQRLLFGLPGLPPRSRRAGSGREVHPASLSAVAVAAGAWRRRLQRHAPRSAIGVAGTEAASARARTRAAPARAPRDRSRARGSR